MNLDRLKYRYWQHTDWHNENSPLEAVYCNIVDGCDPTIAVSDFEFCTGLKDKNGNLIYEGDIVSFIKQRGYYTQKGTICTIEFGVFRFCGFGWRNRPEYDVEFALTESAAKKCEIIGNIHQNKGK